MDVAFFVKHTQYIGPKYTKVKGWWISVAYPGRVFKLLPTPETIVITLENIPKWKRIDLDVTELPW